MGDKSNAVDSCLSELIGSWVCSDNQKVQIIEMYAKPHSNTLTKFTLLTKHPKKQSLSNPSGWTIIAQIIEGQINEGPLYTPYLQA